MIHTGAKRLAALLATKNIINPSQIAIYAYGLELIISGSIGIMLVIVVSAISRFSLLWIPYLFGYILFRTNAGGFHAKSHKSCILIFLTIYEITLLMRYVLLLFPIFPLIISSVILIPVILYAPLDVERNPLSSLHKKKRRIFSIIISIFNVLLAVICILFQLHSNWLTVYYLGVMAASLLFIFAIIQLKLERRKQK